MMLVKQFSLAEKRNEFSVFEVDNEPEAEQIKPEDGQYVAFVLEDILRVGKVKEIDKESGDVKVVPLINSTGKVSNRFSAKEFSVELWISNAALLCIVEPPINTTVSGGQYKLHEKDFAKACNLFELIH